MTRSARKLVEPPTLKKRTGSARAVGVWNRQSGDRIKGCEGACIHASSLTGVGG